MLFKSLLGTFEKKKAKIETVMECGMYTISIPLSGLPGNFYSSLVTSLSDKELTRLQTRWRLSVALLHPIPSQVNNANFPSFSSSASGSALSSLNPEGAVPRRLYGETSFHNS